MYTQRVCVYMESDSTIYTGAGKVRCTRYVYEPPVRTFDSKVVKNNYRVNGRGRGFEGGGDGLIPDSIAFGRPLRSVKRPRASVVSKWYARAGKLKNDSVSRPLFSYYARTVNETIDGWGGEPWMTPPGNVSNFVKKPARKYVRYTPFNESPPNNTPA